MNSRIAFTGAHSTGKTTLIDSFAVFNAGLRVRIIKEIARGVIAKGFSMDKEATIDSYMNYVNDQLKAERQASDESFDVLLSDRTILDAIAYSTVNNKTVGAANVPEYVVQVLEEIWRLELRRYDFYVYCPVEFELIIDGVRGNDPEYRVSVGNQIKRLLDTHAVDYVTVTGSKERRLQILMEKLKGHQVCNKFPRDLGLL